MSQQALEIDGSQGEGGGQVLRTSLALSLVTQTPLRLTKIRAGRSRPGLRAQHRSCVLLAAQVGEAEVEGAELGSRELRFCPRTLRGGEFSLDVGTAGSTGLVLQTVLPALLLASEPSVLKLRGGTHNPWAPSFDFVAKIYAPLIERMGGRLACELERPGFFPKGGGRVSYRVTPAKPLRPLSLLQRGALLPGAVTALLSRLPNHVGERELKRVRERLGYPGEIRQVKAKSPGNSLSIHVPSAEGGTLTCAYGERGRLAEAVADEAVQEAERFLRAEVPVGEHLADQLVLLLALAGGGNFRTLEPSLHTQTQLALIPRFLPVRFGVEGLAPAGAEARVEISVCKA